MPLVLARGVIGSTSPGDSGPPGGASLCGNGNRELRFLLRRGSLKKVVCVETVWVVVVVEP